MIQLLGTLSALAEAPELVPSTPWHLLPSITPGLGSGASPDLHSPLESMRDTHTYRQNAHTP